METLELGLAGLRLLRPKRFDDERGCFAELYNERVLVPLLGLRGPLVQDNCSRSVKVGTVRALHFQRPPNAQAKLVRVTRGAILDVAVDLRRSSASYGRHVCVPLSERAIELLWIPEGFAHGFVTIEPDTEVTYKTTAYYSPQDEVGLQWNDAALGIAWGVNEAEATLSARDREQQAWSDFESPF